MATVEDLDAVIERCQQAMREFGKGNPKHMQALYSHREDVTIATAIDPPARGWEEVALRMERSASNLREGEIDAFETVSRVVTPELAYVVWVEHHRGKVRRGGRDRGFPLEGHDNLPCGGRHLEDRPPARGHGDHAPPA
jgi:hypothetical protein